MTHVQGCIDSPASLRACLRAGVDSVELCSALSEGGLTPLPGFVETALEISTFPVGFIKRSAAGWNMALFFRQKQR